MADLDGMALFVRVIDAGSLSAAARSLGLPKSTVSRRLTQLEATLGVPLLHRSTRALTLTDAGRIYLDRVRSIVRDAEEAELEIKSRSARAVGLVRISATVAFGQGVLSPILCRLMEEEPGLRIDLRLAEQRLNIFSDNLDLAIRMGALDDSELVARKLCTVSRVLVAAPGYLKKRCAPTSPRDLETHACIVTSADLDRWTFADGTDLRVPWRLAAGSVMTTVDAALAGHGIALVPRFVVEAALADGRLIEALPQHPLPPAQATALYPRDRVPSIATKRVVDMLVAELAGTNL
jgi:DNA-binding transcriptional LysR family regulator